MNRYRRPVLIAVAFLIASHAPAYALCPEQDMAGAWLDSSGPIGRLDIRFPCPDDPGISPGSPSSQPDFTPRITAWGLCDGALGICNWGTMAATYRFVSYDGNPQTTRLDVAYADDTDKRSLTILKISPEELLVYMSVEFPPGGGAQPFSTVQHFKRSGPCSLWRGALICKNRQHEPVMLEGFGFSQATCMSNADCGADELCDGTEGCGAPWTCVPSRPCTKDLRWYCGCDGESFRASGSCPGRPYAGRGPCDEGSASRR